MPDPTSIPPPREPSAASRGDPMLAAVGVVESAMQLARAGTGGPPSSPAPSLKSAPARSTADALLGKTNQRIARQAAEVEAQARQLEAQRAEIEGQEQALREAVARREEHRRHPRKMLEDAGLTLEDLAATVLNDGPPPELLARAAEREVQGLREELAERDRKAEAAKAEAQRAERDEARAEVRANIASVVKADPDKYELIGLHGKDAEDLVYRTMEQAYRDGHPLPAEEAAAKVEAFIAAQMEGALKGRKLSARLKPQGGPGAAAAARPGGDPIDAAVAHLVASGWSKF